VRTATVAPRTSWGVLRAAQEFGPSASVAGVSLTGVRRELAAGSLAAAWLPREAVTGGADWNLRFRGGDYELGGFVGGSVLRGDTAAVRRVQTAPAHYFQRPDRDYAVLDSTRTLLGGNTAGLSLRRNNAAHWLWRGSASAISPGFDVNDAGRMSVADFVVAAGGVTYRETRPAGVYRGYDASVYIDNGWDYQGVRRSGSVRADGGVTWRNYWSTDAGLRMEMRRWDASATRGGPRLGLGRSWRADVGLRGRETARVRWAGRVEGGAGAQGGRVWQVSGSAGMDPGPNWQLSVQPRYERSRDPRQYVATLEGGPVETQGRRYVFSAIDRSTLAAPVRVAYTVTPDLSLEVYAEPFAASGRYSDFGQLAAPRSFGLDAFGAAEVLACGPADAAPCTPGSHLFTGNGGADAIARDFNVRSFRSNAVLRWEWRPGSTLFVVWQQDRSSRLYYGDPVGAGAFGDVFQAPGNNVLAVKMTYWVPVR
jgi:hypothetical protein